MAPIVLKIKGNKSFQPIANLDNEEELSKSWRCLTKVAGVLENGSRLENLSWRLWHLMSIMKGNDSKTANKHFRILSSNTTRKLETEKGTAISELKAPIYRGNGKVIGATSIPDTVKEPSRARSHKRNPNLKRSRHQLPKKQVSFLEDNEEFKKNSDMDASTRVAEKMETLVYQTSVNPLPSPTSSEERPLLSEMHHHHQPHFHHNTLPFTPDHSFHLDGLFSSFNVQAFLNTSAPPMLQMSLEDIVDDFTPYQSEVPSPIGGNNADDYFSHNPVSNNWYEPTNFGGASSFEYDVDASMNSSSTSEAASSGVFNESSSTLFINPAQSPALTPAATPAIVTKNNTTTSTPSSLSISPTITKSVPQIESPKSVKPAKSSPKILLQELNKNTKSAKSSLSSVSSTPSHSQTHHHQHQYHPLPSATASSAVQQICSNCGATSTPLWRRSADDELLCNACGLYLKLHKQPRPKNMKPHVLRKDDPRYEEFEDNSPPPVCSNCQTTTTPLWRRDTTGKTLCNACGLYLKLHHEQRPLSMKTDVIKKRTRTENDASQPPKKRKRSTTTSSSQSSSRSSSGATTPVEKCVVEVDRDSLAESEQFAKFAAALTATREQLRKQGQPVSDDGLLNIIPILPSLTAQGSKS